ESESRRFAHPLSGAEFADHEAVRRRRSCGDHHRAERLHGERCGAGASVWIAEVRHAGAARSQCYGFAPDRNRRRHDCSAVVTSSIPIWREAIALGSSCARMAYFCDPYTCTCATPLTMETFCAMVVSAASSTSDSF